MIDWTGNVINAPFRVFVPADVPNGKVQGACKVSIRGLRVGYVPFELSLGAECQSEPRLTLGTRVRSAFASYASKDRNSVLARVQGMEKFIRVFMDVRDLDAGSHYPTRLLEQIDGADVLYLFWSPHAKRSHWVEREWRYALERRGINFIDPVPLVDPRKVRPPRELIEKHFDDWTLAYREYHNSLSYWHRLRAWTAGNLSKLREGP